MQPIDHTWYHRPPGVPEGISAGGVVARLDQNETWIALAREGHRTAYILPKGHIEPGESLQEAATREIYEEAGFTEVKLLTKLGVSQRLDYARTEWKTIHFYLFATRQVSVVPGEPDRHLPPAWFHLDRLPELFWPDQRRLLEQKRGQIREQVMNLTWR